MGRRPNPDPSPAVDRLRKWLDLRDLSQVGLARALDVHEQLVYGWTSGRIRPSYEHAAALERLSGGIVPVAMWADPGETAAIADAALEKIDKKSA